VLYQSGDESEDIVEEGEGEVDGRGATTAAAEEYNAGYRKSLGDYEDFVKVSHSLTTQSLNAFKHNDS